MRDLSNLEVNQVYGAGGGGCGYNRGCGRGSSKRHSTKRRSTKKHSTKCHSTKRHSTKKRGSRCR